jgi:hypothetical protein
MILISRDAVAAKKDFYRGYVQGYEEGLNRAWDDLIGLTTKGFSPREIQVMAKSKRQSIGESVRGRKLEIRDETGIDLLERPKVKESSVRDDNGNVYLIEALNITKGLTIVNELTADGTKALCLLRSFPGNYHDGLNSSVTPVWMAKQEVSKIGPYPVLSPSDLGRIVTETRDFLRVEEGGEVLLGGVEDLIVENDVDGVLKFLQTMMDQAVTLQGVLLLTVYPNALDERVLGNLRCITSGTL